MITLQATARAVWRDTAVSDREQTSVTLCSVQLDVWS